MKKGLKISLNILSGILVTLLIMPILFSLVLSLNPVQNYITKKATNYLTEFLGSEVSIGHIDISNIYNISIENLYVKDPLREDTMFQIDKIKMRLGGFDFKTFQVVIENTSVSGGFFRLNQYYESMNNIKYFVEKFRDDQPGEGKTHLRFNGVKLNDFAFHLRQYNYEEVESGINFTDMSLLNIRAEVDLLKIDNAIISGKVKDISLRENDNMEILNLSAGNVYISPDGMRYEDVEAKIGNSIIDVNHCEIFYKNWDLSDFVYRVPMSIDVKQGDIYFDDVVPFTKKDREWKTRMGFSGTYDGTVNNFRGKIRELTTLNTSIKNCDYHIKGIPDIENTVFDIELEQIDTNTENIHSIINEFTNNATLDFVKDLKTHPSLSAKGIFKGKLTDFHADLIFNHIDNKGNGEITLDLKKTDNKIALTGDIKLIDVTPHELYQNIPLKDFKDITARLMFNGSFASLDDIDMNVKTYISSINLYQQNISGIALKGDIKDKKIQETVL